MHTVKNMSLLKISNLTVSINQQIILDKFSIEIPKGEIHVIMGPNGSGKSTLANVIAGHKDYTIHNGKILLNNIELLGMSPDEIAKEGLFLAFQYPCEISGVSIANFIRSAVKTKTPTREDFDVRLYYQNLYKNMDLLKINRKFTSRSVNVGFSGGEKKRCEMLQMLMLEPRFCILDETDSGLDIDALMIVANSINKIKSPERSILIITHYQRLLEYIIPDKIHIILEGRIIHSGDQSLALKLESEGYDWARKELSPS